MSKALANLPQPDLGHDVEAKNHRILNHAERIDLNIIHLKDNMFQFVLVLCQGSLKKEDKTVEQFQLMSDFLKFI